MQATIERKKSKRSQTMLTKVPGLRFACQHRIRARVDFAAATARKCPAQAKPQHRKEQNHAHRR